MYHSLIFEADQKTAFALQPFPLPPQKLSPHRSSFFFSSILIPVHIIKRYVYYV